MEAVRRGGAEEVIKVHGLDRSLAQVCRYFTFTYPKIVSQAGAAPNMSWDGPEQPEQPEQKAVGPEDNKEKPEVADQKQDVNSLPAVGSPAGQNSDEKRSTKAEVLPNGVSNTLESPKRSKGISNKAFRMPAPSVSLSGGQMQRVAISRAFMRTDKATLVVLE
jgi:hypothetical protein